MRPQKTARFWAVGAAQGGWLRLWIVWLWWWLFMPLVCISFFVDPLRRAITDWSLWPLFALASGYGAAMAIVEQFSNYRWRLLPDYRRVWLTAAAAFAAMSLLIIVGLYAQSWADLASGVGLAILAFSLGCWAIAHGWFILLDTVLLVLYLFGATTGWLVRGLDAARTWQGNLICAALGGWLLVRFVRWLVDFNDDYRCRTSLRVLSSAWRMSLGTSFAVRQAETARRLAEMPQQQDGWWLRWQDWWFERVLRRGPGSFGWSVRRWSLGALPPVVDLWQLTMFFGVAAFYGVWFLVLPSPVGIPWMLIAVPTAVFLFAGQFLMQLGQFQRRPTLAIESLRPVTRARWLRQLGTVVLWRLAVLLALMAVLGLAVLGPWLNPNWPAALAWWSLALAIEFAWIGAVVWLRIVRPAQQIDVIIVGFCAVLATAIAALIRPVDVLLQRPALSAAAVAGCLLVGMACFHGAYRRWLTADLE